MLVFILFFISNQVEATNGELIVDNEEIYNNTNSEIEEQEEEQIMMYNARTGETTEVDMDSLRQEIREKLDKQSINDKNTKTFVSKVFNYNNELGARVGAQAPVGKVTASILRYGSGVLVARNLVLTAAHCVWNEETKEVLKDWTFYAAYNGGPITINGQKLVSGWGNVYYSKAWVESKGNNPNYDWALCELYLPIGDYGIRSWKCDVPPSSGFKETHVGTMGYPTDYKDGAYQWQNSGYVAEVSTGTFTLDFGAPSKGISGAPVFSYGPTVNGVWSTKIPSTGNGVATKVTSNMLTIINKYK